MTIGGMRRHRRREWIAFLLLPALAFRLSACVGSLTAATLFRSLALVYNAALTRRLERTPEALALSAALFALTALRRDECRETSLVAAAGVAALLLAATLCGVVLGVRQEERRTWRSVYVLRVPLFGALLLAFGAGAPRIDLLALYTLLSALSAHSVIAYNAAVAYDSYAATRLLAVRRLASVGLGVLLEQYGLAPALFAAAIGGAATLSDLGARLWAREAPLRPAAH